MEELRNRIEAFWTERETTRLEQHARGDGYFDLREVYRRYEDLSAGEPIDELNRVLQEETLESRQDAPRRLLERVRATMLEASALELTVTAAELEGDWDRRGELLGEAFVKRGECCAGLGYETGRRHFSALYPDVDLDGWCAASEALLEQTAGAYRDSLQEHAGRAALDATRLSYAELQWLSTWSALDSHFESEGLVAVVEFCAQALGVSADRFSALDFRSAAGTGVACFAPRIPDEVVVSTGPVEGAYRYYAGLAASGSGMAFAHASPELPVERRIQLDPGLRQGWGFFFANYLSEERWLRELPVAQRSTDFVQEFRGWELIWIRHAAVCLQFERALAELPCGAEPGPAIANLSDWMQEGLGVAVDPRFALQLGSLELHSLHQLRGRAFARQLQDFFKHEFGRDYWRERRCGDLLRELWQTGATYSAEQIAAELGFGPLGLDPLFDPS